MPETDSVDALDENQVVGHVCRYLEACGYKIESSLTTKQKGDDIIATRQTDGLRLLIEAKGATSARENSYRYGRPFESAAVRVHVAEAVFKSAQVLSAAAADGQVRAGIALPDNYHHRRLAASVGHVLSQLRIAVFWVGGDGDVSVESDWRVPA